MSRAATLHLVSDPSAVWHGGIGHRLLYVDSGVECYRCGMAAENDAIQEAIPDCLGPDGGLDHHWMARDSMNNECAYGDYLAGVASSHGQTHCVRA